MAWCTVLLSCLLWPLVLGGGMFTSMTSDLIRFDTTQLNYGVAVTNVGAGEGAMEWIVAGYNGPNLVLQLDSSTGRYRNIAQTGTPYESIMDEGGAAIGVCACDVDGDGLEEIYFLNTNNRYSGPKLVKDKLFKWRNGQYVDLFSDEVNSNVSGMFSGRSVACVDRIGNGKYGILVATYAQNSQGRFGLVEMNEADPRNNLASGNIVLHDVATEAGINFSTGGRGIVVGPILGEDGFSDIYFVNEGNGGFGNRGDNALFKNDGSGHFTNVATQMNMNDANTGRGVTIADFNNDGLIDITYGNWMNDHKLFLQGKNAYGIPTFTNVATQDFANPSPIRTVIAADFDNNGNLDIFMNNIVLQHPGHTHDGTNNLFEIVPNGASVQIVRKDIGDAEERTGYGTGASVADIDNDGVLELLIAHGESSAQGLSFYHVNSSLSRGNNWLRVLPLTQYGAPARGAKVTVTLSGTRRRSLTRVIDGGSGYLCAMEPVAHFGLGDDTAELVRITWPNGQQKVLSLTQNDMRKTHRIPLSGAMMSETTNRRQGVAVVDRQSQSGRGAVSREHVLSAIVIKTPSSHVCATLKKLSPGNYYLLRYQNGTSVSMTTVCVDRKCKSLGLSKIVVDTQNKKAAVTFESSTWKFVTEKKSKTLKKKTVNINNEGIKMMINRSMRRGKYNYILTLTVGDDANKYNGIINPIVSISSRSSVNPYNIVYKTPNICKKAKTQYAGILKLKKRNAKKFMF